MAIGDLFNGAKNALDNVKNSIKNTASFGSALIQGSNISSGEWNVIMDRLSKQGMSGDYKISYEKTNDGNYLSIYDNNRSTAWMYDPKAQTLRPVDSITNGSVVYTNKGDNILGKEDITKINEARQNVETVKNGVQGGSGGGGGSVDAGGVAGGDIASMFSGIPSSGGGSSSSGTSATGEDNRSKSSDENLQGATTNLTDYETYLGANSDVEYKRLPEIIANYESALTNFVRLSNGQKAKINFLIFPKYITSEADLKSKSYLLRYKVDIPKFTIESRVRKFGYTGKMTMIDNNNSLKFVFNNMMNYYMAICITYLNDDAENGAAKGVIYEPYIVQLEEAREVTNPNSPLKHYEVTFRDTISAIAQDISWANIYYFNPTLQYPLSFETLITGVINHLFNISDQLTGDGKITLRRDIIYSELSKPGSCSTNLASFCLSEINPEGSILDALDVILTYASCELPSVVETLSEKSSLDLSWFSENDDSSILFPLYISEEFADPVYVGKFMATDIKNNATSEKNFKSSEYKGTEFSSIGDNSPIAKPVTPGSSSGSSGVGQVVMGEASATPPLTVGGTTDNTASAAQTPASNQTSTPAATPAQGSSPTPQQPAQPTQPQQPAQPQQPQQPAQPAQPAPKPDSGTASSNNGTKPTVSGNGTETKPAGTVEQGQTTATATATGGSTPVTLEKPAKKERGVMKLDDVYNIGSTLMKTMIVDQNAVKDYLYIPRQYAFKNILTPFQLAFNKEAPIISESINPICEKSGTNVNFTEDEKKYTCFFNRMFSPIYAYTTFPINLKLVSDMWKNIMFMGNMADESQTDVFYLEWILNYFADIFLNMNESNKFPSPTPAFLVKAATLFKNVQSTDVSKNIVGAPKTLSAALQKVSYVAKTAMGALSTVSNLIQESISLFKKSSGNNSSMTSEIIKNEKDKELFNYYFSNVKVLKSLYPVAEECWYLGKYLESFIHYNTSYGIRVLGNMLRRPNEILKLNKPMKVKDPDKVVKVSKEDSSLMQNEEYIAIDTTTANSDSVLLYIMSIEHVFDGDTFTDNIFCNRFYDECDAKIKTISTSK